MIKTIKKNCNDNHNDENNQMGSANNDDDGDDEDACDIDHNHADISNGNADDHRAGD